MRWPLITFFQCSSVKEMVLLLKYDCTRSEPWRFNFAYGTKFPKPNFSIIENSLV